jgi:hypothetical protein
MRWGCGSGGSSIASPTLWTATSSGFRFKDKEHAERGIKLKAKGADLPVGAFVVPTPVAVQLINRDSELCRESVYAAGDVTKSDAYSLKAQK